ncbi:putative secreted protein [Streptomyces davaonensis JCM 4913]|uniref:Putative secreted protein n=1 Tax=Streptomyces davaonensis (strain DSM 101723 / JCM 4913 / KCC S-0913 / 768) TaxID=1214101 RepID=K4RES3_STRDJ|nr:putative secreted protein [Streptomyces davaonensis JCM 4913]
MPPALRKRPVSPARAAAVLASPPGSLTAHRLLGALVAEPAPAARPVSAVTR